MHCPIVLAEVAFGRRPETAVSARVILLLEVHTFSVPLQVFFVLCAKATLMAGM